MDKNSNGGVKVSVSVMTFFLCKKEHFNNLHQFSNMDLPSIKYLFFFFCQLIFSVQNKNEAGHMLYPDTATHTIHSIFMSLTLLNVTFDLLVGMSELALDQTN